MTVKGLEAIRIIFLKLLSFTLVFRENRLENKKENYGKKLWFRPIFSTLFFKFNPSSNYFLLKQTNKTPV
jgi:hypothetical protein